MIKKPKYPALDRPFMQTRFQGYGSGANNNNQEITMASVTRNLERIKNIQFNAIDQHTGTYDNTNASRAYSVESTNTWPDKAPDTPAYELEIWTFFNEAGNRDSGNYITYLDENGDEQTVYAGNSTQANSTSFLSTTQYPIPTQITGFPVYELRRAYVGAAAEAVSYPFTLQSELDAAHAQGQTVAEVQAEYDANGLGQG